MLATFSEAETSHAVDRAVLVRCANTEGWRSSLAEAGHSTGGRRCRRSEEVAGCVACVRTVQVEKPSRGAAAHRGCPGRTLFRVWSVPISEGAVERSGPPA